MAAEKYTRLMAALESDGKGTMKCFGNSMRPILPNPSTCDYVRADTYEVGDIVFCKVKGRFIDAHIVTKKSADGRYMIANNHGYENGWTGQVYGRVVVAYDKDGKLAYRATR
jgi:hypothetical protein